MTNEHTSLEKYTSHTLFVRVAKGLCVRGELETEQTATYWPQVPLTIAALLSHSAGLLNQGSWGPKPSAGSWFSLPRTATRTLTDWYQLSQTVCCTGLYNCLTSICFLWASQLHRIQPVHGQGDTLMSSTGCTCFLIDGWIEGQYVTVVWMVSNRAPTSKSSRPFNNPLVTVPKAPIIIGIIVTFMFHSFFISLARSRYLLLLLLSSPRGKVANVQYCDIIVNEFEL